MRQRALAVLLTLLFTACGPTIQGYPLRGPRPRESRQVAELLDPLLITLELPSLRIIAASSDCKIGFAVARTDRFNVWSSPANTGRPSSRLVRGDGDVSSAQCSRLVWDGDLDPYG